MNPLRSQRTSNQSYNNVEKSTQYSTGRPPWFDILQCGDDIRGSQFSLASTGAFLIGIAGGSASGKTSVSEQIIKSLDVPWVVLLSMDSFYKALNAEQVRQAHQNNYNFDDPGAFDYELLLEVLKDLKSGKSVNIPVYDFKTHNRLDATRHVYGANVVIFEGIYALFDKRVIDMMDLRIFVDTDDDVRLARRLKRDIAERGRDMHGVIQQYSRFVKPSFDTWIRPTMGSADVIIPRGADNAVAIDLLTKNIARQLDARGYSLRSNLAALTDVADKEELPDTVYPMELTPQMRFIHTMIRNKDTPRDDFIFYAERLSRLVVESALSHLPFNEFAVKTPTGHTYKGLRRSDDICGVSIIRAGLTMEQPLRRVCPFISIGKLLIQTSPDTHEPHLHFCRLPVDIARRDVLLMDATISTGAAMVMAIRVLLDHGVAEDRIIVLCLIANRVGLKIVTGAFPKLTVVVSEIDVNMDRDSYQLIPGMGNVGDRYFGTAFD